MQVVNLSQDNNYLPTILTFLLYLFFFYSHDENKQKPLLHY